MASGPRIFTEETPDTLRCLAVLRPLVVTLSVAGVILLLYCVLGWHLIGTVIEQLQRQNVRLELEMIFGAVWLVVFGVLCAVIGVTIRRQRAPNGIVIESGTVQVFTPEQTKGSYRFPLSELGGAELSQSARTLRVTGLTIRRRRGWAITMLVGFPAAELTGVMDAVNRKVVQDQFHAFQVLPTASMTEPTEG